MATVFSNKGLKDRHWDEISNIVGGSVRPDRKEYLNRFILMDLPLDKYSKLEEISDSASKEFGIERIMDKMKGILFNIILCIICIYLLFCLLIYLFNNYFIYLIIKYLLNK